MRIELPENFVIPEYVKSIDFIEENLDYIDAQMADQLNGSDINEISEKITDLMAYRPVVNDLYASAKYYLNEARRHKYAEVLAQFTSKDNIIQERYKTFRSPSVIKDYIKTLTADFEWLYDKCERTNRGLTHYLDECRTLVSKEKVLISQTT